MKNRRAGKKQASIILLGAALLLIVLGLVQGDFFSVLGKAVFICLECIGIG